MLYCQEKVEEDTALFSTMQLSSGGEKKKKIIRYFSFQVFFSNAFENGCSEKTNNRQLMNKNDDGRTYAEHVWIFFLMASRELNSSDLPEKPRPLCKMMIMLPT